MEIQPTMMGFEIKETEVIVITERAISREELEKLYHRSVSNDKVYGVPEEDIVGQDNTGEEKTVETAESGIEAVPGYDSSRLLRETVAPSLDEELEAMLDDMETEERLVDAAFAEFFGEAVTIERVFPPDDRVRIRDTTIAPWRWICHLDIEPAVGRPWQGTGWFCSPRTVITAGHCVYMHRLGGWVKRIAVSPGRNSRRRPFHFMVAKSFRSVDGWIERKNRYYDYGAIILPSNRLGKKVGEFGIDCLTDKSLSGLEVNLSGYPSDKPLGTQWFHANKITSVTNHRVYYKVDTFGGQSGSPVWRVHNGHRGVVAIHTTASRFANSGIRITEPVRDNIEKWKQ
jgi:V8-like Glu-specific endopeptidase